MPQPVTRLAAAYCAHERWHWIRGQVTLFQSIYAHGFMRIAVGTPRVALVQPAVNVQRTIALAQRAAGRKAALVLFPELGLSAYSGEDLLLQDALLDDVERAVQQLLAASRALGAILIVGAPLRSEGRLYNCALVMLRGALLGVVPKIHLPNYREFYEPRHFVSGDGTTGEITVAGHRAPFGTDLLFAAEDLPGLVVHAEICEDVWVPIPPSAEAALAGATVLANLSASNITIGKADTGGCCARSQSARCLAAYLYAAAGPAKSTTDLAWDGQALGLRERRDAGGDANASAAEHAAAIADIDLDLLRQERARMTSFVRQQPPPPGARRSARWRSGWTRRPATSVPLTPRSSASRSSPPTASARAGLLRGYNIQVPGWRSGCAPPASTRVVIGVSGGLDSTQALIVAARAFDVLGLPARRHPRLHHAGFRHLRPDQAQCAGADAALGVTAGELDIRPAAMQMLATSAIPSRAANPVYDVTFENVQAGLRTDYLFRLANHHDGLVIGTGDLSELALGWCTYGVGDQMSHYNVNAGVPKTLIQHLIRWIVAQRAVRDRCWRRWTRSSRTEISPELIPPAEGEAPQAPRRRSAPTRCRISTSTTRCATASARRRSRSWRCRPGRRRRGDWPPPFPPRRRTLRPRHDRHWLGVFLPLLRAASSSVRPCRTGRRSAPAARSRRAATGARRAMRPPTSGSKSLAATCPEGAVRAEAPGPYREPAWAESRLSASARSAPEIETG